MKLSLFAVTVSALATQVVSDLCGVDDVIASLQKVSKDASLMDTAAEVADDSIAHDSPVYKDYKSLDAHFNRDLRCDIVIENPEDQQRVCDEYAEFAANQKESVDVGLDDSFMEENEEQPEAGKVHEYAVTLERSLTEDLAALMEIYPAA
ncbi:hypothetical protein FE257_006338 [Aspergillus nanangensis]|uniref:Uncharacterized protein n=1 Tax=Aspergillus nanangensis TaxID=2582783 RepID=A0AAD4CR22_ASPNN|nr:hypothetical protein FE257_006338 [Aspergillus nanangensis]